MEQLGIVYSFVNTVNGKRYIGQTLNPSSRYKAHLSNAGNENDLAYEYPLSRAIRKYGMESFHYEVLGEDLTIDEMNELEVYYIEYHNSIENGYNILEGGRNSSRPMAMKTRQKLSALRGALTEEEVQHLRIAYANHESPSEIYNQTYKDFMHYNSFLNIWSGSRYKHIMPEVFKKGVNRTVKYTPEIVTAVRQAKIDSPDLSYKTIGEMFNIPKSTVVDMIKRRTWKHIP